MNILKSITTIILLGAIFMTTPALAQIKERDKTVPFSELPGAIQQYVKSHFPNQSVTKVEVEMKGTEKAYEVKLDDKTELEFNSQLQVEKIESKNALPASTLPTSIQTYVRANYPNNAIKEWEIEKKHQEVKLDNGIALKFDLEGAFLRIGK
jgi:hypothetical protein